MCHFIQRFNLKYGLIALNSFFFLIKNASYAGGAPARSGRLRRQRLHSVMNACKQSFATLVLHAIAKNILGRRFYSHDVNLSSL